MLAMTSVIVEKCVFICFPTFTFYRRGPKCRAAQGNFPLYSPFRWAWVH